MASQNPQEITLLPAIWDAGDVPIQVPEDCTWGIPKEMMPDVWRLLGADKIPDSGKGRFSLQDFQHLISLLYLKRSDKVSLKDAIAEEIAALRPDGSQTSRDQSPGSIPIPPFNGRWVRITGTGRRMLPDKQRWIAEAIGVPLAAGGYGLLHDGFPGVDDIVANKFSSALKEQGLSVAERVKMFPSPMHDEHSRPSSTKADSYIFDPWGEATNEIVSAVIVIGGEGGAYAVYQPAMEKGIPVIPVRGSGGDADICFRRLTEGREAVAYRDILMRQSAAIEGPAAANATAQQVLEILHDILSSPVPMTKHLFTEAAQKEEGRRKIIFVDDIQRGRWGRSSVSNGYELEAVIPYTGSDEAKIHLAIRRSEGFPQPKGWVAFYYQKGRQQQVRISNFENGVSTIEFDSRQAFTVGAYMEDGTVLELDLNEVTGAPGRFYYTSPPDSFRELVSEIYRKNKVKVVNDIHKNRWGEKGQNNGKQLSAHVTSTGIGASFKVVLEVIAQSKRQALTGWVAFFVPFEPEIVYCEARESTRGGTASITINAREAFTVGAMTQDGTLLELDLQEIKGFPAEFYYEKRKLKIDRPNPKGGKRPKKKK